MDELSVREIFPKRLAYYMTVNGKNRNDLVRDLGLKYSTVRDWEKGITIPRMGKVEMLANYFNCKKSDLIEDKGTQPIVSPEIDEKNRKLAQIHRAMVDDPALMLMIEKLAKMSTEERASIQPIFDLLNKNK